MIGDIIVASLLVISGLFGLVGSIGLLKLPDPMMRLHAPTKATTLGVGAALVASMVTVWTSQGRFSLQELLVTLFLFLAAPVTCQFLAKLHLHQHRPPLPPATGTGDCAGAPDRDDAHGI